MPPVINAVFRLLDMKYVVLSSVLFFWLLDTLLYAQHYFFLLLCTLFTFFPFRGLDFLLCVMSSVFDSGAAHCRIEN